MRRLRIAAGLVVLCWAAASCTSADPGADKAGGVPVGQAVLRMASTPSSLLGVPAVADFVRRVADLSHGSVRIVVNNQWGQYAPDDELQVVTAVSVGTVDLGWAGSRVFDAFGISSFQALSAPMLIDNYPLERAVLGSGIPDEMLGGLPEARVTGLGVLGDGLRRPIGLKRPLVRVADWSGISFGSYRSHVQEESVRTLGAVPQQVYGPFRDHAIESGRLDGFEFDIRGYNGLGIAKRARHIAGNVVLWPQFDVLFANNRRLATLTVEQRNWLHEAAAGAAVRSVDLSRETVANVERACANGARFGDASSAELATLRAALSRVYRDIERDEATKVFVQRIRELKRSTPPGPGLPIPTGCRLNR